MTLSTLSEIDENIHQFYAKVINKDSRNYGRATQLSLRHSIERYLNMSLKKKWHFAQQRNPKFVNSNQLFDAKIMVTNWTILTSWPTLSIQTISRGLTISFQLTYFNQLEHLNKLDHYLQCDYFLQLDLFNQLDHFYGLDHFNQMDPFFCFFFTSCTILCRQTILTG